MDLLDFYIDADGSGRKWTPQDYSEEYVFLRSEHYGHVQNLVIAKSHLQGETLDANKGKRFSEKTYAYGYLCKVSNERPKTFENSIVRNIMAKYQKP